MRLILAGKYLGEGDGLAAEYGRGKRFFRPGLPTALISARLASTRILDGFGE